MESAVTIGLDLGKSVFQVHGICCRDSRDPAPPDAEQAASIFCEAAGRLVGMEACAAAHHWGRELQKLRHSVRLMPPRYVKPYV